MEVLHNRVEVSRGGFCVFVLPLLCDFLVVIRSSLKERQEKQQPTIAERQKGKKYYLWSVFQRGINSICEYSFFITEECRVLTKHGSVKLKHRGVKRISSRRSGYIRTIVAAFSKAALCIITFPPSRSRLFAPLPLPSYEREVRPRWEARCDGSD